jgi:hypothetical protein
MEYEGTRRIPQFDLKLSHVTPVEIIILITVYLLACRGSVSTNNLVLSI